MLPALLLLPGSKHTEMVKRCAALRRHIPSVLWLSALISWSAYSQNHAQCIKHTCSLKLNAVILLSFEAYYPCLDVGMSHYHG